MTTTKISTPVKSKAVVSKTRNAKVSETPPHNGAVLKAAPNGIVSPAGFSPRRLNKPEGLAIDKKDIYFIVACKGGIFEIIYLDSKRNKANDGYFPFVTGLATDGNGQYKVIMHLPTCDFLSIFLYIYLTYGPLFFFLG
jgi:hypothetical protein